MKIPLLQGATVHIYQVSEKYRLIYQ